jgi:hypothetical protein
MSRPGGVGGVGWMGWMGWMGGGDGGSRDGGAWRRPGARPAGGRRVAVRGVAVPCVSVRGVAVRSVVGWPVAVRSVAWHCVAFGEGQLGGASGGSEYGYRDDARDDGDDHRDDEGGVHEFGGGQAAYQRRGDHEQRPQELRGPVWRLSPAGLLTTAELVATTAPAVRAHCPTCAVCGVRRNVTDFGPDPTSAAEQIKPLIRFVPLTALVQPMGGFTHTS